MMAPVAMANLSADAVSPLAVAILTTQVTRPDTKEPVRVRIGLHTGVLGMMHFVANACIVIETQPLTPSLPASVILVQADIVVMVFMVVHGLHCGSWSSWWFMVFM